MNIILQLDALVIYAFSWRSLARWSLPATKASRRFTIHPSLQFFSGKGTNGRTKPADFLGQMLHVCCVARFALLLYLHASEMNERSVVGGAEIRETFLHSQLSTH